MKIHEIRELKDEELIKQLSEEQKNMLDLRFAHQLKQLTNTAKLKINRRDIAKMKTELKARQVAKKVTADKDIKEGVNA